MYMYIAVTCYRATRVNYDWCIKQSASHLKMTKLKLMNVSEHCPVSVHSVTYILWFCFFDHKRGWHATSKKSYTHVHGCIQDTYIPKDSWQMQTQHRNRAVPGGPTYVCALFTSFPHCVSPPQVYYPPSGRRAIPHVQEPSLFQWEHSYHVLACIALSSMLEQPF